ncbi:MAG: cob(I)yrinic acid a,c-diamide adenosyltransferase [Dehalococcoidia bacterium]|nr:cob(I)yrinic acid a,c-diamide adenosyltransferase [Dehalococcoidia bacterium]
MVLTGQNALREVQREASLVTEMLMIKHPSTEGIIPHEGIGY